MQVVFYGEDFLTGILTSSSGIVARPGTYGEVQALRKKGTHVFSIEAYGDMVALGQLQGLTDCYLLKNEDKISVTLIEHDIPDISPESIVTLFDVISGSNHFRYQKANPELKIKERQIDTSAFLKNLPCNVDERMSLIVLQGLDMLSNKRFCLSLYRFHFACSRADIYDTLLDCCATIESLFSFSHELGLRYTLAAYHIDIFEPPTTAQIVKRMYHLGSERLHGRSCEIGFEFIDDVIYATSNILMSLIVRNKFYSDKEILLWILTNYKVSF